MSFYLLKPCRGKAAFEAIPKEGIQLDMGQCKKDLAVQGFEIIDAGVMLVAVKRKFQVSIYPSGKLLIHTASREDALDTANGLFRILGIGQGI